MKYSVKDHEGIPVVHLSGKLEGGDECLELVEIVSDLGRDQQLDAVLNFKKVKFISSTGLGILMRARARFMEDGGIMRLCELSNRSMSVLMVTKVIKLFESFDTEKEAVAAAKG